MEIYIYIYIACDIKSVLALKRSGKLLILKTEATEQNLFGESRFGNKATVLERALGHSHKMAGLVLPVILWVWPVPNATDQKEN